MTTILLPGFGFKNKQAQFSWPWHSVVSLALRLAVLAPTIITTKSIICWHWPDNQLEGLGPDSKIGFLHPHLLYRETVIVLIGREMLHWVKKFQNIFDNTFCTLVCCRKSMSLGNTYERWNWSGDVDISSNTKLWRYEFTHNHFNLIEFLKTRVFFTVQFISQILAIRITKDYLKESSIDTPDNYKLMIELSNKDDSLVDINIVNGCDFTKGKNWNFKLINHPKHCYISKLFNICMYSLN
jgi:hypothetical protein